MRWTTRTAIRPAQTAALLLLTRDVARHGRLARWETGQHRPPQRFPPGARVLSAAGSPRTLITAIAVGALSGRCSPRQAISVLAALGLRARLAQQIARPRPPAQWWEEQPHGSSFPSRHTTYAMLVAGLAAATPSGEALVIGTGLLVGSARLRLGVHWPTDVLGAVLATDLWWRLTMVPGLPVPLASDDNGAVRSAPRTAVPADDLYPQAQPGCA